MKLFSRVGKPVSKKIFRHLFAAILLVLVGTVLGFFAVEMMVRFTLFTADERSHGVAGLYAAEEAISFENYNNEHPGCLWEDSLVAHPYLQFVHHAVPPCGTASSSREGFEGGRDIPRMRDPNYFTILLVGTSVAEQLGSYQSKSGHFLAEEILNEKFISPTGKPFRILNGAVGATARPAADMSTLLYGDVVDGVISLDGYNETNGLKNGGWFAMPSPIYLRLIRGPASTHALLRHSLAKAIRDLARNGWFSSSYFVFFAQRILIHKLSESETDIQESMKQLYFRQFFPPPGESLEQSLAWNRQKYKTLVRANQAIAQSMNARFSHFLQPIPAFKKYLTEYEKRSPITTTEAEYQNLIAAIDDLTKEHVSAFSLVHIFDNVQDSIYIDSIHCGEFDKDFLGYRIMIEEIGQRLVEAWGLKKRRFDQAMSSRQRRQ